MIVALEGPDRCGKSTVFELLRGRVDATFVPGIPMRPELLPLMSEVEERQEHLWRHLYDPSKLYVCDRHFSTSSWVYDQLYGRRTLVDHGRWRLEVRVILFEVPEATLKERCLATSDPFDVRLYGRCVELYRRLPFTCAVLDGRIPSDALAELTLACIRSFQNG